MMRILGQDHTLVLLFFCFIGDTLAVLASCLDLDTQGVKTKSSKSSDSKETASSDFVWLLACEHYKTALKGWLKTEGMRHPNVLLTTCAMARCLREVGRRREALKLLASIDGVNGDFLQVSRPKEITSIQGSTGTNEMTSLGKGGFHLVSPQTSVCYHQSAAICMWSMAVYEVEENPNEHGRLKALGLLHSGSRTLQHALKMKNFVDESVESSCTELLLMIENEAKRLFLMGQ